MAKLGITKPREHFDLSILRRDTNLTVLTGPEYDRWQYDFRVAEEVTKERTFPNGILVARSPQGCLSDEFEVSIVGSGKHTTRNQNPVQDQERAITVGFGILSIGSFLVLVMKRTQEFIIMDESRQEIAVVEYEY